MSVESEAFDLARQLRAENLNWTEVAKRTGLTVDILRRRIDPGYSHRRYAQDRKMGRKEVGKMLHFHERGPRITVEETKKLLATVPVDTRPFFARMMGDPLPGRSALEKGRLRQ